MPEFRMHTLETAPPASQKLLSGLKDQVGFVPNLAATMADSPTLLQAFLGLRSAAADSSLDPIAREIIAIAVATETGCGYCVAAHSTLALKNGADAAVVEAARSGGTLSEARLQALVQLARGIVRRQGDVKAHAQDLIQTGLTHSEVLDVLAAIATPMLASSVVQLAAVELDGAFQAQAWRRA